MVLKEHKIPILLDNINYHGNDSELLEKIHKTTQKLPEDVARFVIDRCVFLSIGRAAQGMCLPARIAVNSFEKRTKNMWIILINENLPDQEMLTAIAHEIAHAWLRHDRYADFPDDGEGQAALKAYEWGFRGNGADPVFCRGSLEE